MACAQARRWSLVAALREDAAASLRQTAQDGLHIIPYNPLKGPSLKGPVIGLIIGILGPNSPSWAQDLSQGVLELAHANIVVALLDSLEEMQAYKEREAAAFRRSLYLPARRQLLGLSRTAVPPKLVAGEATIRSEVLEQQSSLGRLFVDSFSSELFGKAPVWRGAQGCRKAMAEAGRVWDERPVAKHILAWVMCMLPGLVGARLGGHRADAQNRQSGHQLPPLYVEHSRGPHAERQVLLDVLRSCRGSKPDEGV